MYMLVFWFCSGYMCNTTIVPGYYERLETCEAAKTVLTESYVGAPIAKCIKAPENIGFE